VKFALDMARVSKQAKGNFTNPMTTKTKKAEHEPAEADAA